MILVSHAIVGAALTRTSLHGVAVYLTALLSHYVIDAIPHWHYSVPRVKKAVDDRSEGKTLAFEARFTPDFLKIIIDCFIGAVLSLILFDSGAGSVLLAVAGAVTPDFLVGLYRFYPNVFLSLHNSFHKWVHARSRLDDKPFLGIAAQAAFVTLFVFFTKTFTA